MSHPRHLRLRDVRSIFRLIGEVRELGADPKAWRPHMVQRLRSLFAAEIVVSSEVHAQTTKVAGKLHFFAGDMDDFYLNLAVYRFEEFLKGTELGKNVPFTFGRPMKGHSWHVMPWAELVRQMGTHVKKNAPGGEDTSAWWY